MSDLVIKEILKNQDKILSNIKKESIAVYLFLKKEHKKGSVESNALFQLVFRSYYRLDGAELSDKQKIKYFNLMAKRILDLKEILSELYKIKTTRGKKTIQFSFATKLLHTIDEGRPIWDSEIARVLKMRRSGESYNEKVASCVRCYEQLKSSVSFLHNDKRIKDIISEFRDRFKVNKNEIGDVKALDFIIWSLGKIKNKKYAG